MDELSQGRLDELMRELCIFAGAYVQQLEPHQMLVIGEAAGIVSRFANKAAGRALSEGRD